MTTETKTESTTPPASNDNKAVFGPLGKYAIVAVIMVSIIVTTAIMLDRQLKSVDEQIAAIEEEVAEMHAADTKDTNTIEVIAEVSAVVADTEIKQAEVKQEAVIETAAVVAAPETAPATTPAITEAVVETAEALPVQKTAAAPVETEAKQTTAATAAQFETIQTKNIAQAHQKKLAMENQARIEAYKLEQKKHMTEMFARINTLESQRLDRYKANQDGQIVRLRKQISQQQHMIETLVLRNKDLFDMRAANMQRHQENRKQVLNRI